VNLPQRNHQQLDRALSRHDQRQLRPKLPPSSGTYLGFDGSQQKHRVQTSDGSLVQGLFESTGGAMIGDRVAIVLTRGGIPRFLVMPR
jgi:hypothetical protein